MINQKVRFLLVGVLNTVLGFAIYYICFKILNINYSYSLSIAHIIGVINSYYWNKRWTFNVKQGSKKMIFKFGLIYLCTFFINYGILTIFVEFFELNPLISQFFSLLITTVMSYVGQKYWSFKVTKLESEN